MPAKLATRYRCVYECDIPGTHSYGHGKPPEKCRYCGGMIAIDTGLWGVFHWAGYDAKVRDYQVNTAVKTFVRMSAADRMADDAYHADNNSDLVVRWISIDSKSGE